MIVLMGAGLLVLILFWSRMTVTINSGEGGVLFETFGSGVDTENTYSEGFHFIAPWNKMFIYEMRQQEVGEKMKVLSSNGLDISVELSAWYMPSYDDLGKLHQKIGQGYLNRVVRPAIRSATRSVIGRYEPEQIYSSKRDIIQEEIYAETQKILEEQYVQLNEILVRDVVLPPTIKNAIESKLKQEQEALEYKFRLQKATQEAEKIKIDALGKAKANEILSASLNDKILKDKGIEATIELAKSPNSKVIIIGGGEGGLPIILGDK
ncbi:MAG: prohibitin family protein [Flavobacteriales bacterium]|nr:prohibitin family protein [Flavobacteriales bacterium]